MSISTSIVNQLLKAAPHWRSQMYFKSSLTALSHAMEDQVLAGEESPLIIASFQRERFYRQEANRYRRIAEKTPHVYVLAAPETSFSSCSLEYETVAFDPTDALSQEWHLIVISKNFASCLICREKINASDSVPNIVDNNRRFEGIWTYDRSVSEKAARLLLDRIATYRPELKEKIKDAKRLYLTAKMTATDLKQHVPQTNSDPFVQRLLTYLQAGQYKLIKANRSLASKEERERLINSITTAIRRSLNTEEILQLAVQQLGRGLDICRCIVYRCQENDDTVTINHEFLAEDLPSLNGQTWPLKDNPLFQEVVKLRESLSINDTQSTPWITQDQLKTLIQNYSIFAWLLVPIFYQEKLLGMLELHRCTSQVTTWKDEDIALINAIATQVGVALIQAESYANLEKLNEQLEALDRTRSNLVAITGHELRTPLSTIQVCLESLATEPDMPAELRQVMLDTALQDAERMRTLVQDFLTLSQLESGRVEWTIEPLMLDECVELALSHVKARQIQAGGVSQPTLLNQIPDDLPLVQADGEWLVEVIAKLLDNACKFTDANGQVVITIAEKTPTSMTIGILDNGRGIEPKRLETVFDRFYQEEGALRRSAGGTGLGLAICRQIVMGWGGNIWAESAGKDRGSQFFFTVPVFGELPNKPSRILGNAKAV